MTNLFDETLGMLEASELPVREIAQRSGVGARWLALVKSRKISDPGVQKIQRVHDFLSEAPGARDAA